MINGRGVEFEADDVEVNELTYTFKVGLDTVAEFTKANVAGYVEIAHDENEDEDYGH